MLIICIEAFLSLALVVTGIVDGGFGIFFRHDKLVILSEEIITTISIAAFAKYEKHDYDK
jgi:hypothetical protein